jgi:hypothetical protein
MDSQPGIDCPVGIFICAVILPQPYPLVKKMFDFLQSYFFTGVTGNIAYEALKKFWRQVFGKDLETLYLDAFEQAVADERLRLSQYGDLVELDREALRRALRAELHLNVEQAGLAGLSADDFIQQLAEAMHRRQALIIGGHNLTVEDCQQLLRNLIRYATTIMREKVLANEASFNEVLIGEVEGNQRQLVEVQSYLSTRFDLALQKLNTIETQTRPIPDILTMVQNQSDLVGQMAEDVQAIRRTGRKKRKAKASNISQGIDGLDVKIARDTLFAFFRDTSYFSGSYAQDVVGELRNCGFSDEQAKQLLKHLTSTRELKLSATHPRQVFVPRDDISDMLPVRSHTTHGRQDVDEAHILIATETLRAFFRDSRFFSGSFGKDVLGELHAAGFAGEQARQLLRHFVQTGELDLRAPDPHKAFIPHEKADSILSPIPSQKIAADLDPTANHRMMRRQRLDQRRRELETQWNALTERIEAVQHDLAVEMDGERRLTLQRRLDELEAERDRVEAELNAVERQLE